MIFKKSKEPEKTIMSDKSLLEYLENNFEWKYDPYYKCFVLPIDKIVHDSLFAGALFLDHPKIEIQNGQGENMVHIYKYRNSLHKTNKETRDIQRAEIKEKSRKQREAEKQYLRERDSVLINILEKEAKYVYHVDHKVEILEKTMKHFKNRAFKEFYYSLQQKPQTINGKLYTMVKHKIHRTYPNIENDHKIKSQIQVQ